MTQFRTPSHQPVTRDELIPGSNWATREGDIPRSHPDSVYSPPLRLNDFLSFVRDHGNLQPHAKALICEVAEQFKGVKQAKHR